MAAVTYLAVVKAEYDYTATTDDELSVTEEQQLYVVEYTDDDWWKVRVKQSPSEGANPADAPTGLIPATYVTPLEPLRQVVALYDYEATSEEEISIQENQTYDLYEDDGDWTLVGARDKKEVGFAPTAYLEDQAAGATNGHAEQEEQAAAAIPAPPPPPPPPAAPVGAGAPAARAATNGSAPGSDKVLTWANVTSVEGKKKKKGTLGIGNGSIFFASDSDKAPVQKKDLSQLASDPATEKGKNIKLSFTDREHLHFTVSKDDFDAIVAKIEHSRSFADAGGPAAAAAAQAAEADAEEEDTYVPPPPPPPPGSTGAKGFGFLPPPPRRMVGSDSEDSDNDDDDDAEPPRRGGGSSAAPAAAAIPAPPPPPPMPAAFSPPPAAPRTPIAPPAPAAPAIATAPAVSSGAGGGKRAKAEYDFTASEPEELSIAEGETLYVLDDSADDWWKVRNERGEEGEVPASYVELLDEDGAAGGGVDDDAEAAKRLDEEQRAEAKKERERLRLKKLEEEARGMSGFANFQPPPARKAAASPAPKAPSPPAVSPPPPAPPAPPMIQPPPQQQQQTSRRESKDNYDAAREERRERHRQREREREARGGGGGGSGGRSASGSAPVEKSKPSPARVRTWADKSGAFKVDAEFVGLSGAKGEKIRLHKLNGVVIEVPLEKMSADDVRLIEHLTRKRAGGNDADRRHSHRSDRDRDRERGDRPREREREREGSGSRDDRSHQARPPSASAQGKRVSMAASQSKKSEMDWFDWFLNAGCDVDDCERYARNFEKDRIDESIVADLEPATLRSLGLREGDVIRVRKYIAKKNGGTMPGGGASSSSATAPPPPTPDKDARREREDQMMSDEELARKLQEEMNAGRDGSGLFTNASGGVKNTRRGRPQPKSAPSAASFDSIASSLTERSTTPANANERVRSPDIAKEPSRQSSSTAASSSGFDDDAWTVKPTPAKAPSPAPLIDDGSRSAASPAPAASSNRDLASIRQQAASPAMPATSKEASSAQALTDAYLDSIGLGKRAVTESGSGLPVRQAAASPQPPQITTAQQTGYAQQQSPQQTGYYPSQSPVNNPRQPIAPIPLNQQLLNPLIPTQTGMTGFIPTRNMQSPMGMMPQQTGYQQPQQTGFPGQSPFGNQHAVPHQPYMQQQPSYGGMMQPQPTGYPMHQMSQMSIQPTGSPYQQPPPQQQMQIPQAPPPPPMQPQQTSQPQSSQSSDFQPSSIFAQMKAGQFAKSDNAPQQEQKYDALRPQQTSFNPGMSQGYGIQPQQAGFGAGMQPLQAQPTGFAPGGYLQPQQQNMMFPQQTGYQYRPY